MFPYSINRCRTLVSLSAIIILSLTPLASTTLYASDDGNTKPVTVYQHVNFGGRSLDAGEGNVSIQNLRASVGNDRISSIRVAPGYTVLACQHSRLRGRCETFTSDNNDFREISFNDVVSSLRIGKTADLPAVIAYQHVGFNGRSLAIDDERTVTISDLISSGLGNDVISSIRITDGYEVRACEHSRNGGSGRCETYVDTISDLRTERFNDTISFLQISRVSGEPEPNNPPVTENVSFRAFADEAFSFDLDDLRELGNSSDPDGDEITLSVPANEFVTFENGRITFDPTTDFGDLIEGDEETVAFDYIVEDDQGLSAQAQVIITIVGVLPTFNIGDTGPAGGVVFSVSLNGTRGLEFARDALSSVAWGCETTDLESIPNLSGFQDDDPSPGPQLRPNEAVQSGLLNAGFLTEADCDALAAQAALDYTFSPSVNEDEFADWYLPSIVELLQIARLNLSRPTVANEFEEDVVPNFWSSTEETSENAWFLQPDGSASNGAKNQTDTIYVLPVRSF